MMMFDPMGVFTRQFTPVEGGFLYYPSRKSGGKFVSLEEYDHLMSGWRRVAGRRATWISAGFIGVIVVLWTIVRENFALPDWTSWIVITVLTAAFLGWLLRASLAPRRLVASRPDITPPRPHSEARRAARAVISWPLVAFVLLLSGLIFFSLLISPERTPSWWAWIIGSGLMFGAYVWLGFQKLTDRQH